jgi:predicted CXXCH cytochrome family protein
VLKTIKAIDNNDCKGEMMKRFMLIALAVAFVATAASAQTVVGTKHDLSSTLSGTSDQVCAFCHTPHGSNVDAVLDTHAPLWNQDLPLTASYGTYTSDPFNATDLVAVTNTTYSVSLLCMSCHDGTVAPGSFYNEPNPAGTTGGGAMSGDPVLGIDLSSDHPVNFTYASSVTGGDTGLEAEANITAYLDTGAVGGKVQCSSCHDPHDAGLDANINFMRITTDQSLICTTCHNK